jgi:hypothetical protein
VATEQQAAKLERLRSLAEAPGEQQAYALRLLEKERGVEVVLAALAVLKAQEDPRMRPALLQKYAYCDANGVRRDPGGHIRAAILHALRPIALPEDAALAERAATTYEFLFGEATGDLRAAGLLTLNAADAELAGYHCVRLLTDEYTSIMSGEPAVTAVKILAAHSQLLPLYAYVTGEAKQVADVVAESLRSLHALPPSLLPALVEQYGGSDNEIVLLGLFDLLLAHESRPRYIPFIRDFLRTTTLTNIYRYLAIVLVTSHDTGLIDEVRALAEDERDPVKVAILREALALR